MPSSLRWLAHDADEDDRLRRVLALLRQSEARDELGIGSVRDSLADHFFPGTSTVQTRLRYFLIIPWVYLHLERSGVPARDFAAQGRKLECDLIAPLLDNEDSGGVFGRVSRRQLARLPSDVYWAGLGHWGVRTQALSRGEYHGVVDRLRARRKGARRQDGERVTDPRAHLWHSRLPTAPEDFPERVDFTLTPDEARFIHDRIVEAQPDSLLAWMARVGESTDLALPGPWDLRAREDLPDALAERLEHAHLFSAVFRGAPILYNLMIAELAEEEDERAELIREARAEDLEAWAEGLDRDALERWSLDDFWAQVRHPSYKLSTCTRGFVEAWVEHARSGRDLASDEGARRLIRQREERLKGSRGRSRFRSPRLRETWSGRAGMVRLSYRWGQATRLLGDLYEGLGR